MGLKTLKFEKQCYKKMERQARKREREEYHLFCFALHYYLLEPEGEPAIVPEREKKEKEEEMRTCLFMHSICLKTRLCLTHQTQVGERELKSSSAK